MNYKIQNLEDQLKIITEKLSNSNKEIDELK